MFLTTLVICKVFRLIRGRPKVRSVSVLEPLPVQESETWPSMPTGTKIQPTFIWKCNCQSNTSTFFGGYDPSLNDPSFYNPLLPKPFIIDCFKLGYFGDAFQFAFFLRNEYSGHSCRFKSKIRLLKISSVDINYFSYKNFHQTILDKHMDFYIWKHCLSIYVAVTHCFHTAFHLCPLYVSRLRNCPTFDWPSDSVQEEKAIQK